MRTAQEIHEKSHSKKQNWQRITIITLYSNMRKRARKNAEKKPSRTRKKKVRNPNIAHLHSLLALRHLIKLSYYSVTSLAPSISAPSTSTTHPFCYKPLLTHIRIRIQIPTQQQKNTNPVSKKPHKTKKTPTFCILTTFPFPSLTSPPT